MTVFIAGSRRIARLPQAVRQRIDGIVMKEMRVFIGDANGADRAVQQYLAEKGYRSVLVHCMEGACRNNLGGWPVREVAAPWGVRGFDFYSLKDRVMADSAEYGLMLWDGKSKGTINNVVCMSRQSKPVVVYVAPAKSFLTVRSYADLGDLLAQGDAASVSKLAHELRLDGLRQNAVPRRAAG
jgi:hypothetical protein